MQRVQCAVCGCEHLCAKYLCFVSLHAGVVTMCVCADVVSVCVERESSGGRVGLQSTLFSILHHLSSYLQAFPQVPAVFLGRVGRTHLLPASGDYESR